jgi:hypothetical protein
VPKPRQRERLTGWARQSARVLPPSAGPRGLEEAPRRGPCTSETGERGGGQVGPTQGNSAQEVIFFFILFLSPFQSLSFEFEFVSEFYT